MENVHNLMQKVYSLSSNSHFYNHIINFLTILELYNSEFHKDYLIQNLNLNILLTSQNLIFSILNI